jgi:hypothetical protein
MSQQRFNENGFPIKECPKCKTDYNINSFVNGVCFFCDDMVKVKVWEVINGDYNDIYSRNTIKATGNQIDDYVNGDKPNDAEDIGSDSIGWITYDEEGLTTEFFEAVEIEDYNEDSDGKVDIDLIKED